MITVFDNPTDVIFFLLLKTFMLPYHVKEKINPCSSFGLNDKFLT